jgi:hypothetical protein
LAKPNCSLTTLGTSDVSTPRNVTGTFGIFSCRSGVSGAAGGTGGPGGAGGVCANPAMERNAMAAVITMDFVFIVSLMEIIGQKLE